MRSAGAGTVLDSSSRWRGELECGDDVLIDGHFEGSLKQSGGQVTIGANAQVKAQVTADNVRVLGRVHGDIHSADRVTLHTGSVVMGNVYAKRFSMEEGAMLRGRVVPDGSHPMDHALSTASDAYGVSPAPAKAAPLPQTEPLAKSAPVAAVADVHPDVNAHVLPAEEPVVARSGRQLPSALAAFASGRKQPSTGQGEAEWATTSPWRVRVQED